MPGSPSDRPASARAGEGHGLRDVLFITQELPHGNQRRVTFRRREDTDLPDEGVVTVEGLHVVLLEAKYCAARACLPTLTGHEATLRTGSSRAGSLNWTRPLLFGQPSGQAVQRDGLNVVS